MARKHRLGRSQKYHPRPRHLYALLFNNGGCYVGQSVDLGKRLQSHRSNAGGWGGAKFHMVELGVIIGTYADAEQYEYAWRYKASKAGWLIYGKPGVLVNPTYRLTFRRRMLAWTLSWPGKYRRKGRLPSSMFWLFLGGIALMCFYTAQM